MISMVLKKKKSIMYKLNLIRRYMDYKDTLKELADNNTMEIAEFIEMDNNKRDIVLFSLITATKMKQEAQGKLLWLILTVLLGSTGGVVYCAAGV